MVRRPRKRVAKRAVAKRHKKLIAQPRSASPRPRHNLPTQLTSFIGRERELAEVRRLLSSSRMLTLTGAAGCGKTRLALHVASDMLPKFSDGVWMVDLAPLSNAALVPQAIATALDILEQPGRALKDTLVDSLRRKVLLLLLDNCEHVLASCAEVTHTLMRECPGLRILATSREPLAVAGEIRWRVPSLSLPDLREQPTVARLMTYEAIRLFVDRATAADSEFGVTNSTVRVVAQVCRQLDGIPLAIELAAACTRVLAVEQIAQRLSDRFRLLTGGMRTALPRHQTLGAAMDWSYEFLSQKERTLLRRLSVFAGGWTLEAAEAICQGKRIKGAEVLGLLTHLADKSLVVVDTSHGEARYRLLETVRQYVRIRLVETGEATVVHRRHLDWFLRFAERAEPELRGPTQGSWLVRLETEHDNMRAALEWSKTEAGLRLAGALYRFWFLRGHWSEGRAWLESALSAIRRTRPLALPKALRGAAQLAWRQGDDEHAVALTEKGMAVCLELGDKDEIAWHHLALGTTLLQSDLGRAKTLLENSLALSSELGDQWRICITLVHLGIVERYQGNYGRALEFYEKSHGLARETGDKWLMAHVLRGLGALALHQGDYQLAARLYMNSLTLCNELDNKWGVEECLEGLAGVACAQGQPEQAARLFGTAEALRETLGFRRLTPDQAEYDERVSATRAELAEAAFTEAWARGRAMTLEQSIECAQTLALVVPSMPAGTQKIADGQVSMLTPRQREVAVLVAQGLSNRKISTHLVIAEKTADAHVQHILNKLGFHSRAQIAAWAVKHGLSMMSSQ